MNDDTGDPGHSSSSAAASTTVLPTRLHNARESEHAKPKPRAKAQDRMTPHQFIEKWRASELKERSASQEHFIDLCHLLGEPTPAEADPSGETYCFGRG